MKRLSWMAAGVVLFAAGCANHLEDVTKETPENTRSAAGTQYVLTMDREIPDSTSFKVTVEQVEDVQVTVHQVRKVSALYTPYQGWRESYEVLSGVCLFPVALVSHVFSALSFGMFPFSWSANVLKYSLDGMNPCMNFESRSRVEEIPLKVERTRVDSYRETKRKPLANEYLIVRPESETYWRVKTNELGQAEIVLLSTDTSKSGTFTSRHLDIYLEKENVKCKTVPMSRRLLSRLSRARQAMVKYYSVPGGQQLAECVKKLEELSFENLAYQLEEAELKKHPEYKATFNRSVK
ncbi:MAG: hypothetical protein IJS01_05535 [Lentisphaeria bacterium]|nr:hypothetical protein [Lentisphaeria bacterium]